MAQSNYTFQSLYDIIKRLRGPDGCPWDRGQNASSLRECLIEETYECIEAIDEKNPAHIREELGDIFLLAGMLSFIHEEEKAFSVADVFQAVCEKLVRRHPHVFGEKKAGGPGEALNNWEKIKAEEVGRKPKDSILDGVGSGLPPLDRAWKLQKKAARIGFDFPEINQACEKIKEELGEAMNAVNSDVNNVEEELGDLLFSVVNLCRYLEVEPSVALRRANSKFVSRFTHMEKRMGETGQEMKKENLGIMDQYWEEAKNFGERGI